MLEVKVFTSLFVLPRLCVFFVKCSHWSGHILRDIGPYSTICAGNVKEGYICNLKLSLFSLGNTIEFLMFFYCLGCFFQFSAENG